MTDALGRHAELVAQLRRAVFESSGELSPEVRTAAGAGDRVPEHWLAYVEKVRRESYRITDADVDALEAAGCTEEEIFEITVAAAQGAALQRLEAGLRALGEAKR
jgi:alkylhydroperoxidase family enzyme